MNSLFNIDFERINNSVNNIEFATAKGIVKKVIGLTIEVEGIKAFVGELCVVYNTKNKPINCEVVGFRENEVILMPLGELNLVAPGCKVISKGIPLSVKCSDSLLGKVLDGIGNIIDEKETISYGERYSLNNQPPDPMKRSRIRDIMPTGIRAIDAFMTCGEGQRIGIFAGSGVGKSTTL
ncbi:MAG: EscN/YscN/HrcN family type III secretion system ATPase, partial [Paraclostridium sp.]